MSRKRSRKPWLHEATGYWCTSIDRKRVYLDKDYQTACRKLRELRADLKRQDSGEYRYLEMLFTELTSLFLDDIKARKTATTYQSYRYRLLRGLKILSPDLRVCALRKLHLA